MSRSRGGMWVCSRGTGICWRQRKGPDRRRTPRPAPAAPALDSPPGCADFLSSSWIPLQAVRFLEQGLRSQPAARAAAGHGLACVRKGKEQSNFHTYLIPPARSVFAHSPPAACAFFQPERALSHSHFPCACGRRPPTQRRLAPIFHASALPTRRLARDTSVISGICVSL